MPSCIYEDLKGDRLTEEEVSDAERAIKADKVLKHAQTLSSSEFGGRFPGVDEKLVFDYLGAFYRFGLPRSFSRQPSSPHNVVAFIILCSSH